VSAHTLHLALGSAQRDRLTTADFLWRPVGEPSSFHTTLSPRSEEIGPVPEASAELLRLAALVYLVDRTASRPRSWVRELELLVPVFDPDRWAPIADQVNGALALLTGDDWHVEFEARRSPARRRVQRLIEPAERVSLFSGGADSLCGLLVSLSDGVEPHLVSHWDWTIVGGTQNKLVDLVEGEFGVTLSRDATRLGRRTRQIWTHVNFPKERTSRSRSILFIALGLAAAALRDAELWIPENGFASLNLPLAPERRGALSTRTTHPQFIDELQSIVSAVGIGVTMVNPFESITKAQIFRRVADLYGDDVAARIISASHSCGRPGAHWEGFDPGAQCGVCFGCLVRRAAFIASGLDDGTFYIEEHLRGDAARRSAWIENRRQDAAAVEYRAQRPYTLADVLAASLPARIDPESALDLATRGASELDRLDIPT